MPAGGRCLFGDGVGETEFGVGQRFAGQHLVAHGTVVPPAGHARQAFLGRPAPGNANHRSLDSFA